MKNQMKWGLATLMLLLGIAAVFLFIDKDTETEPEMTLGQPTKDLLKERCEAATTSRNACRCRGTATRSPPE